MKEWNLQDIRPSRGRARGVDRVHTTESRGDHPREHLHEIHHRPRNEEYMREHESEMYNDNNMTLRASEAGYTGTPLSKKMSLDQSPARRYVRIIVGVVLALALFVVVIAHVRATASVTIVPKTITKDIVVSLTAGKSESLPFAIATKEIEAQSTIDAEGVTDVSEPARGMITIYNEYSVSPYTLVKNTRFESEGKIFRIQESATVPGYTTKDGSLIPGTAQVKVFAADPGSDGNINPSQFTVPGLKGKDEEYAKIYARSAESFTGGIIGKQAVVNDEVKNAVRAEMETTLASRLRTTVVEQPLADQIIYADAAVITYTDSVQTTDDDKKALYTVRGTIQVPVFEADAFSKEVLDASGERSSPELRYRITSPSGLAFSYASETTSLNADSVLSFTLNGTVTMLAQLDSRALAETLVGIDTDNLQSVMAQYPAASRISYSMSPAWRGSFPKNPDRITIDVVIPE